MYARQNGKGRETENDSVYQKREVVGKRERERNKNVWRGSKVGVSFAGEWLTERIKSNELRSEWECLCSPTRLHILSQKAAIDSGEWTIRGEASGSRVAWAGKTFR